MKSKSMNMKHLLLALLCLAMFTPVAVNAQETRTVNDTIYNPKIVFTGTPTQYEIAGIRDGKTLLALPSARFIPKEVSP